MSAVSNLTYLTYKMPDGKYVLHALDLWDKDTCLTCKGECRQAGELISDWTGEYLSTMDKEVLASVLADHKILSVDELRSKWSDDIIGEVFQMHNWYRDRPELEAIPGFKCPKCERGVSA